MKRRRNFIAFLPLVFVLSTSPQIQPLAADGPTGSVQKPGSTTNHYTGSVSCRKCHERFYRLWAPSHHGLAMQPFTAELAQNKLSPQTKDIIIRDYRYRVTIAGKKGWVIERGLQEENKYSIDHVMGGKMSITF